MASSYPGALDTLTNPTSSDTLDSVTVPHATQHANVNDAIEAIEGELGTDPSGAAATVAARFTALDTTVAAKVDNPMTANLNAGSFTLHSVSQFAVGTTVAAGYAMKIARTAAVTTSQVAIGVQDALTWGSGTFLSYTAFQITPTLTWNVTPLGVTVMQMNPTLAGSATGYAVVGIQSQLSPPASSALSKWTALMVGGGRAADTVLTVGLDVGVTNALAGTTVWGMQVGNYQSYHQGKLTVGGTTAPTWNLHIQGGNSATNGIGIDVSTTGPTAPASSAAGVISIYKGATNWYLLVTWNDAGTTRYRYMQLNGTTATWTHGTTLPT